MLCSAAIMLEIFMSLVFLFFVFFFVYVAPCLFYVFRTLTFTLIKVTFSNSSCMLQLILRGCRVRRNTRIIENCILRTQQRNEQNTWKIKQRQKATSHEPGRVIYYRGFRAIFEVKTEGWLSCWAPYGPLRSPQQLKQLSVFTSKIPSTP